jgi:precorrin-6B methylase 2
MPLNSCAKVSGLAPQAVKRIQVVSGEQLSNNMQEILSGLQPGQQVVTNAINLQNVIDNE